MRSNVKNYKGREEGTRKEGGKEVGREGRWKGGQEGETHKDRE